MSRRILEEPAWRTAEMIAGQEFSSEEYVASLLERIGEVDGVLNAYITLLKGEASAKAREIDRRIRGGEKPGRLAGLPVAVKDNICTEGVRTTCGSRMLADFIPPYSATVVERIEREGGIVLGKTNLDEFAMGSTTELSHFGPTRNPWDRSLVPGGSSGGSAAAIAAFEAPLALGSDTGGSVRCPASFCGAVGLKPTYGAVSRYGLISYSNSLEQIGPIAGDVKGCALLMDCIAGSDPRDSTSAEGSSKELYWKVDDAPSRLKIGVISELFGEGVQEAVSKAVWRAILKLEGLGFSYGEVSLPTVKYTLAAYYIIAMSEASSNLARYDGLRYGFRASDRSLDWSRAFSRTRRQGFGIEVRRRIILGTYALSAGYFDQYYLKAMKIRTLVKRDFDEAFRKFDILAAPSMPILPFKLGEKIQDPLQLYMCDADTVPANLTGIPSLSVPCGLSRGLPVGLQIMAPPFREDLLFQVGRLVEESMPIDRSVGEFTHS